MLSATLAACVVGEDYQPPQIDLPEKFASGAGAPVPDRALAPWWENFGDKRLNALVKRGLSENLDVRQAMERVIAAQAVADAAGAPTDLDAALGAAVSGGSGSARVRSATAGLSASWLLDFVGRYRRSRESASARLDAAYADVDVARLVYLSNIVSAYIDARYFQERIALKKKELESRRYTLQSTRTLLSAGSATRLDVLQVEGLVNSTLSDLPPLETGFFRSAHRIATLLGLPAATLRAELSKGAPQPIPRARIASGVPADLLRIRPDIRSDERRLAAAVAEVGIAQAQMYPSVSLLGSVTATAVSPGASGSTWSFGPSIDIPILDNGRRRANVAVAEATARERYLAWRSTVLAAVEEVENALAAIGRDRRTIAAARNSVEAYEKALELALTSFVIGEATFLEILDAERSLATARTTLARSRRQLALDYVALNIASGGGYNAATDVKPARAAVAAAAREAPADRGDPVAVRVVKPGETVYRIALQSGVSVDALAKFNGISPPYTIRVGQRLMIPPR